MRTAPLSQTLWTVCVWAGGSATHRNNFLSRKVANFVLFSSSGPINTRVICFSFRNTDKCYSYIRKYRDKVQSVPVEMRQLLRHRCI